MLYISPWKAAAILLTTLLVCLFAVPNFFSERTVKRWPTWAQRHMVLGLDLQGGSHILLEVDTPAVRREKLQKEIDDDPLDVLARITGDDGLIGGGASAGTRPRGRSA